MVQKEKKHYKILKLGSKSKKHLRGSTQAPIHPLAIILTAALHALVRRGRGRGRGVLWPSYCLLCVSFFNTNRDWKSFDGLLRMAWMGRSLGFERHSAGFQGMGCL